MTDREDDLGRERKALQLFEAMLAMDRGQRREWLERQVGGDAELKERVTRIAEADRLFALRTGGAWADSGEEDIDPPEVVGAYRITGLIGSGGMGSVYSARRDRGDFDHEVAIKLVKPGVLSETLVERFARERQLVAGMNHPHIARLFDGGETEDGQPYFVMEKVDGIPLLDWIEQHQSEIHRRLELFLQVCDAVGYAHRNLVVHRDLTPANILVDRDGKAKLIDFGIARPADEEATQGGSDRFRQMTLTPGYAAPERLQGRSATTLGDIYSAGRLLNALLPKPRPRELQAVANKALRREPGQRYQSIEQMAEDIERFLNKRPVEAYGSGPAYAMRKWFLRNPALAIAVVAGLGAVGWSWNQAVTARTEAEERFDQVRALSSAMLFDLYDEIAGVPGTQAVRERLAGEALTYLDSLAESPQAPLDVRLEAARGYLRLAEITGSFSTESLGRLSEGREIAEAGLALLRDLNAQYPDNADVRHELAAALTQRSRELLYATGDSETAQALVQEAIDLMDSDPDQAEDALHLADAMIQFGEAHIWRNDIDEAAASYNRAIELLEALPRETRDSSPYIQTLSTAYEMQGRLVADLGEDFGEAAHLLGQAVAMNRIAFERDPSPANRSQVAISLFYLVGAEAARDHFERVRVHNDEGLQLMRAAITENPEDFSSLALFAAFANQRANLHARDGENTRALALVEEALAASASTLSDAGDVVGADMRHAVRLNEAAVVQRMAGADRQACANLRRSVAIFDTFAETQPIPEANLQANYRPMLEMLEDC